MIQQYSISVFANAYAHVDQSFELSATENQSAWVMNLNTTAVSRYTGFNYNAAIMFNGVALVSDENGIYPLTGSTDQGAPINARVVTAKMDFGSDFLKRVPYIYSALLGGPMTVTTITESGAEQYDVPKAAVLRNTRSRLLLGCKGRYWQFAYKNVNGSDFTLASIDVQPEILTRRA